MTVQQDVEDGIRKTTQSTKETAEIVAQAGQEAESRGQAALEQGKVALSKFEGGAQQWIGWAMDSYQANLAALQAMMTSRSLPAIMTIQSDLLRDQMNLFLDNSRRIAKATMPTR
jgi:hypothetical protein